VIPSLSEICANKNSIETDHIVDGDGRTLQARWEVEIPPPPGFSSCQAMVTWRREGRGSTVSARLYRHKPLIFDCSGEGATFQMATVRLSRALIAASEHAYKALETAWNKPEAA